MPPTPDFSSHAEQSLIDLFLQLEQADNRVALEQIRGQITGKQGALTLLMKQIKTMPASEKAQFGSRLNQYREQFETLFAAKNQALLAHAPATARSIDVTLPGRTRDIGALHPITWIKRALESWFLARGFFWSEGPELEDDYHNFLALNFPPHHPARDMQDTFYTQDGRLLRTHTSPLQIRVLKNLDLKNHLTTELPVRCVTTGRVYRVDADTTHTPMFHQLEAFIVGQGINWGHLRDLIDDFLTTLFGQHLKYRFRSSYFPFTEPSAEIDILKDDQWMEVLGCGLIHPNVLSECGLDPHTYTGLAMGIGLDRLAMQKFNVQDLRWMFENDWRLLRQFER